jgi:hypothetical protein
MHSKLGSKIKLGNAVINSYCESDLQPSFVMASVEGSAAVDAGASHTVTLVLNNVPVTCAGNGRVAPCATTPGDDPWPSYICHFTDPQTSNVVDSVPTQGVRVEHDNAKGDTIGVEAVVKCVMPAGASSDHTQVVTLTYNGKTAVDIPFTGRTGDDRLTLAEVAPAPAPVVEEITPAPAPVEAPPATGCAQVVNLNAYYRACTASSVKPSFFTTVKVEE